MSKRVAPKPEAVPVNVVCSLCGEAWTLHAEVDGEVSTLECIRLLKDKANRIPYSYPYPVYPQPVYPYVHRPYWWLATSGVYTHTSGNIGVTPATTRTVNCTSEQRTPAVALASASV